MPKPALAPAARVTEARKRCPQRKYRGHAETLGRNTGRNLQARHGAGEDAAECAESRICQAEFGLPQRQQDVDEIGVTVVQCMVEAGNRSSATLLGRHVRHQRDDIMMPRNFAHGVREKICWTFLEPA